MGAETAEVVTLEGPLEPRQLRWIADLYGQADPKYRRDDVLEHLFLKSPAGSALHSFALDGERPVGHCGIVPHPGRRGERELRCGKLEALWIEEMHRGRRPGEAPLYRLLLDRLYAFADERGLELVHGHATRRIGRVIRFEPLAPVGEPSWVASLSRSRPALAALATAQRGLRAAAHALARPACEGTVRPAEAADVDLLDAEPPPPGRWTTVVDDAWEWYRSSPLVRVLELPGPHGCRALVQVPAAPLEPLRVVAWRPRRPGLRAAVLLLGAAARLAAQLGAPTLRFQPWPSETGDGALGRACRLLGFIRRDDRTTLWVRARERELARAEAVVPSPLFYLAF